MSRPASAVRRHAGSTMLAEVVRGLSRPQPELSPKYFYDHRGSELFEAITRLPEYYLTRAERGILATEMPALIERLGVRTLVELGAGSGEKTRCILDAMSAAGTARAYVPIDVSASFLQETAKRLRLEYPELAVIPTVADITEAVRIPNDLPGPVLFAFLGSTIGNFAPPAAIRLLHRVAMAMPAGGHLLLGADLRKDPAVLEAAYDDAAGVTAEFNRNMLRVLNRELGADFDPDGFAHRAVYEPESHRIEMHLVSLRDQRVTLPGGRAFRFPAGSTIRTEISCKYDRASVTGLLSAAGFALEEWMTDVEERFALALAGAES